MDLHGPLLSQKAVDDFIIIRATRLVSNVQRALVRNVLRAEDMPVLEWRLLFSIARFGSCHLAFITQRTSIDPAHGSRAASALEKKGMIVRSDDNENRRRKLLSLTPLGIETFERIWPQAQENVSRITGGLGPKDFEDLKRLLDMANAAAQAETTTTPQDTSGKEHAA